MGAKKHFDLPMGTDPDTSYIEVAATTWVFPADALKFSGLERYRQPGVKYSSVSRSPQPDHAWTSRRGRRG